MSRSFQPMPITAADPFSPLGVHAGEECALPPLCGKLTARPLRGALRAVNRRFSEPLVKSGIGGEHLAGVLFRFARGSSNQQSVACLRAMNSLLPAILTVRRHRLPVIARERPIVIPDIADAPIDIRERCPLFPAVGNSADGRQRAVFHSYIGCSLRDGSPAASIGHGRIAGS